MKRRIVVVLSDTHGGHKFALMLPGVTLYDEGQNGELVPYTPAPTAEQEALNAYYLESIEWVKEIAGSDEITVVHNGDLTQGLKYKEQLVSTRLADQILIAEENLRPWIELPNMVNLGIYIGTPAHNFGEGSSELIIGRSLQKEYPHKHITVKYHGVLNIEGFDIDIAHHGPSPGIRDWTRGNQVRFYLKDLMNRCLNLGIKPPELVLRGHHHDYVSETVELRRGDELSSSRLIVTPSWCMIGDHGRQIVKSPFSVTRGLVALEFLGGNLVKTHTRIKSEDVRTKEAVL